MQGCQGKDVPLPLGSGGEALEGESRAEAVRALWDDFYRNQSATLRRIAAAKGLPPDQTEDAIQEVWLAALKNLHRFRGENAEQRLLGWMRKVMHYKAVDVHRSMYCRRVLPLDSLPAERMAAKDAGNDRERSNWLAARLDEAGKQESLNCQLLCAHFQDGRTIADLAAEAGLTKKAIECRIYRWISKLRREAVVDGLHAVTASK